MYVARTHFTSDMYSFIHAHKRPMSHSDMCDEWHVLIYVPRTHPRPTNSSTLHELMYVARTHFTSDMYSSIHAHKRPMCHSDMCDEWHVLIYVPRTHLRSTNSSTLHELISRVTCTHLRSTNSFTFHDLTYIPRTYVCCGPSTAVMCVDTPQQLHWTTSHNVAMTSRLLKIIGLFCKRAL